MVQKKKKTKKAAVRKKRVAKKAPGFPIHIHEDKTLRPDELKIDWNFRRTEDLLTPVHVGGMEFPAEAILGDLEIGKWISYKWDFIRSAPPRTFFTYAEPDHSWREIAILVLGVLFVGLALFVR